MGEAARTACLRHDWKLYLTEKTQYPFDECAVCGLERPAELPRYTLADLHMPGATIDVAFEPDELGRGTVVAIRVFMLSAFSATTPAGLTAIHRLPAEELVAFADEDPIGRIVRQLLMELLRMQVESTLKVEEERNG